MDWKSIIMKNSMIKVTLKTYKTYSNNNNKLLIRSIMIINVPKMVNNKKMIRNINQLRLFICWDDQQPIKIKIWKINNKTKL